MLWPLDWKIHWCWERLRSGGDGGDRGWDAWMASSAQHEVEQTAGDGERQGSLVCCSPRSHKESGMTEQLNNNSTSVPGVWLGILWSFCCKVMSIHLAWASQGTLLPPVPYVFQYSLLSIIVLSFLSITVNMFFYWLKISLLPLELVKGNNRKY